MEFFKKETHINFMGYRRHTVIILTILSLLSIVILVTKGLNLGLDFTGGTQIDARFEHPVDPSIIRNQLEHSGLRGVKVQQYGSTQDFLIRVANPKTDTDNDNETEDTGKMTVQGSDNDQMTGTEQVLSNEPVLSKKSVMGKEAVKEAVLGNSQVVQNETFNEKNKTVDKKHEAFNEKSGEQELKISKKVREILQKDYPNIEIRRIEFVGSEVGEQLVEQGVIAVLMAIFATMIYIALRFEYRLAVSAAVGLIHDAILLLGIFAIFGFEFDLATLASVLAVLGYSLNDTIVVFDRVRENFRKVRKGSPVEIMNLSINQTLSRTIMTSLLTLLVVLALLFFGGESLFGFSMAFFLGILIGTVSSIYVSGALALWMGLSRADLMPKPKTEYEER